MAGKKNNGLRGSQQGDTIVSILLSIAVITLVIVLAYTLVSQSLRRGQAAREREQVKNLIQSQIEGLKNLAVQNAGIDDHAKNIFHKDYDQEMPGAVGFCLEENGTIISSKTVPSVSLPDDCEQFSLELNLLEIKYDSKDDSGSEQHLFTVTAKWDSAAGGQESSLSVPIRIHPLNQLSP